MDDIVIGSGPAGVSAALALLERGRKVTLLDGGRDLEPEAELRRSVLAGLAPPDWSDADRAAWQQRQFAGHAGQVRRFGSDFAMEPAEATFAERGDVALRSSRAAGGLSNLWGAAVLPYAPSDMAGWPVSVDDMHIHYRHMSTHIPISGTPDDLSALFPSLSDTGRDRIAPSIQAEGLMARLTARRDALTRLGATAGYARQAVDPGCRLCGQCLHGCPFNLIWSARHLLARLRSNPNLTYRPGAVVNRLEEAPDRIVLHLADGTKIFGKRAFLGAGVLETARILLSSQPDSRTITLRDSQQAFLPTLHRWSLPRRPDRGAFHTLPQVFIELQDRSVSPHLVHSQIYTWNEYFPRDLIASYGKGIPGTAPLLAALARRLIVAQVFLHSEHSHRIALRLAPDGRLAASVEKNPETSQVLDNALRSLGNALRFGGVMPLRLAARPGAPGASFHVGASVPMAAKPVTGQSDTLGRPHGLHRLHLIDASSLPAIPATTITFSVMANAHRIGSLAPD